LGTLSCKSLAVCFLSGPAGPNLGQSAVRIPPALPLQQVDSQGLAAVFADTVSAAPASALPRIWPGVLENVRAGFQIAVNERQQR
jgi:hypothetical protein